MRPLQSLSDVANKCSAQETKNPSRIFELHEIQYVHQISKESDMRVLDFQRGPEAECVASWMAEKTNKQKNEIKLNILAVYLLEYTFKYWKEYRAVVTSEKSRKKKRGWEGMSNTPK